MTVRFKSPLHVGIITNALSIGGSETQLLRLCQTIDPAVVKLEVVYYSPPHAMLDEFNKTPAKVTFIDRDKIGKIRFIFYLAKYIKKTGYDVVHCWRGNANQYGALAAVLVGHKCILTGYRNIIPIPLPIRIFDRIISKFTIGRVVNSCAIKKFHKDFLKYPEQKIAVLFNGINISSFTQSFDIDEIKESLVVHNDLPLIVSIGRLVYHKRHELLINAASRLKSMGYKAEYVIVGDGPHKQTLVDLVKKLDLEDTVHFAGVRRDVAEILAASCISVCCSVSEGFPNVILESMISGKAVITTDNGGGSEMICNNEQVIPVDDIEALTSKLILLLENGNIRKEWANKARQLAQRKYSLDLIASQYVEILKDAYQHGKIC